MFKLLFSTLFPAVAYVNESKSIRFQLFLVLKMNFKRDMPIKEKKISSVLKLFKLMEYIHR